jgi:hypothetical protein
MPRFFVIQSCLLPFPTIFHTHSPFLTIRAVFLTHPTLFF